MAVGAAIKGATTVAPKAVGLLSRMGSALKGAATGSGIKAQGQIAREAGARATKLRGLAAKAPVQGGKAQSRALQMAAESGQKARTARLGQAKAVGKTVGLYGGGATALGGAGYGAHRALSGPSQTGATVLPKYGAYAHAFFDELAQIGL